MMRSFSTIQTGSSRQFNEYLARPENTELPSVAYFSMEFGIHPSLKIYSGGLGVLAGDYLKEASDSNVRITGIGLLYRYGYFRQKLGPKGEQQTIYEAEDFSQIPVTPVKDSANNPLTIFLTWPGRTVKARVWLASVGKVNLFLLDTDIEENTPEDRAITHYLYGGDFGEQAEAGTDPWYRRHACTHCAWHQTRHLPQQ